MQQVQVDEFLVTVDAETAEHLKDPGYAASYAQTIRETWTKRDSSKEVTLWKSSKCPTDEDHEATLALLELRKKFSSEFDDKKTHKIELWQKIANALNKDGYYVGEGVQGREKVRQKFANLYTSYIKYKDARKRTGEGKLKTPKYLPELEEILGDKHKVTPVKIIDSAIEPSAIKELPHLTKPSTSSSTVETTTDLVINDEPLTLNQTPKATTTLDEKASILAQTPTNTRFQEVKKRIKPKSPQLKALQDIIVIQKENQEMRATQFSTLINVIQEQNKQRHEQLMALISTISKKRKRNPSSDDSGQDE